MLGFAFMSAPVNSVLVVGLGLIGGSVLKAAKDYAPKISCFGYDIDASAVAQACEQGISQNPEGELLALAEQVDLVVVAVPPLAFATVFETLAQLENAQTLITDVASVKAPVLKACREHAARLLPRFVPGHPIAGAERSGLASAKQDLFTGKKFILTPHDSTSSEALQRVRGFWGQLRCETVELDAQLHDYLLASTSHLPHALAYVLIDSLMLHAHKEGLFEFAAGGLRDVSRTASSDPTMWHDVFFSNKKHVLEALDGYQQRLQHFRSLIENDESEQLFEMLRNARDGRNAFIERYKP